MSNLNVGEAHRFHREGRDLALEEEVAHHRVVEQAHAAYLHRGRDRVLTLRRTRRIYFYGVHVLFGGLTWSNLRIGLPGSRSLLLSRSLPFSLYPSSPFTFFSHLPLTYLPHATICEFSLYISRGFFLFDLFTHSSFHANFIEHIYAGRKLRNC